MHTQTVKPPIGVRPRYIADEQRKEELISAILRYQDHPLNMCIPVEWIEEYNEIVERQNNNYYKPVNGISHGHFQNESLN